MKRMIAGILCFALTAALCACGSNVVRYDTTPNNGDNSYADFNAGAEEPGQQTPAGDSSVLIGSWYAESERDLEGREANCYIPKELILNSDGTGDTDFFEINYSSESIEWSVAGQTLTIKSTAFENTYDYTISGNTLILRIGNDYEGVLHRR